MKRLHISPTITQAKIFAMKTGPKITRLKSEHRIAGLVYEYLNKKGFTDPVIAGILGNMMAECGGQTLELRWDIYGGGGTVRTTTNADPAQVSELKTLTKL